MDLTYLLYSTLPTAESFTKIKIKKAAYAYVHTDIQTYIHFLPFAGEFCLYLLSP